MFIKFDHKTIENEIDNVALRNYGYLKNKFLMADFGILIKKNGEYDFPKGQIEKDIGEDSSILNKAKRFFEGDG